MAYTKSNWLRWGLCIVDGVDDPRKRDEATLTHDKVANYLDKHSCIAAKYKADQTGEIKYFDVLRRVEEEEKRKEERV